VISDQRRFGSAPKLLPLPEGEYVFSVLPASRWQDHGHEADRRVVAAFLCNRLPFRRQDAGGTLNAYGGEGEGERSWQLNCSG